MPTWLLLLTAWVGGSIGAGLLLLAACALYDRLHRPPRIHR